VPVDDKCEECWELWHEAFKHMPWEELCSKNASEPGFPTLLRAARDIKNGVAKATFSPSEVSSSSTLEVEVSRSFVVLSEKEMRAASNLTRITKAALKGVPQLTVPAEDGSGNEVVYCFRNEAMPFRVASVKVRLQESKAQTKMSTEQQYWAGQAAAYFTQAQTQMSSETGLHHCLDKDSHNSTFTWDEFLENRLNQKSRAQVGEMQETGRQTQEWGDEDEEGEEVGLVGAAASAASASAPCASPATKAPSAAKGPASRDQAELLTPQRPRGIATLGGSSGMGFARSASFPSAGSQAGTGTATPPGGPGSAHGSEIADDRLSEVQLGEGQWL
jgi:hypothetical protein